MASTKNIFSILFFSFYFFVPALMNAQTQLWGMTNLGGQYGAGTIFNIDSVGNNESVQHSFSQTDGAKPLFTNLIQANDGTLYGMTYEGGTNNLGVFFQYNPVAFSFIKKFDFDSANGSKPLGSLLQANDGMIYGMTYKGGIYGYGVLFQYNPTNSVYTKKFDFDNIRGCYPHGSLIQANDGMLYGMAVQGGTNNFGVLFQYNPVTSTYTKKFDFDSIHGSYPLGSLVQTSDSMFYGFATQGGVNNMGVLFQYNPVTATYIKKIDFAGIANGNSPLGFLIEASDLNLYGMTNRGGVNDKGVLFQYNPTTANCIKKLDFDSVNGSYPDASLMQTNDGNIYGMTNLGGTSNMGVLFQYNPTTSAYTKKLDFNGTNGEYPYGSLIIVNTSKVGISNYSNLEKQVPIFPNPNNGAFTIQSKNEGNYSVVNALGQTVQTCKLSIANNYTINIENLSKGVYFLIGFSGNQAVKQKIVVVK